MAMIDVVEAKARFSAVRERVGPDETADLRRRHAPIAEVRILLGPPAGARPVGIDRGMTIPDSFFEPLPAEIQCAFGAQGKPS